MRAADARDEAMPQAAVRTAHKGAGGRMRAPASAAKPSVNLYNLARPAPAPGPRAITA